MKTIFGELDYQRQGDDLYILHNEEQAEMIEAWFKSKGLKTELAFGNYPQNRFFRKVIIEVKQGARHIKDFEVQNANN